MELNKGTWSDVIRLAESKSQPQKAKDSGPVRWAKAVDRDFTYPLPPESIAQDWMRSRYGPFFEPWVNLSEDDA